LAELRPPTSRAAAISRFASTTIVNCARLEVRARLVGELDTIDVGQPPAQVGESDERLIGELFGLRVPVTPGLDA
jgi:hypothetical protein